MISPFMQRNVSTHTKVPLPQILPYITQRFTDKVALVYLTTIGGASVLGVVLHCILPFAHIVSIFMGKLER